MKYLKERSFINAEERTGMGRKAYIAGTTQKELDNF